MKNIRTLQGFYSFSIEEIKKFEFKDVQIEDFTPYLLEKNLQKGYQNTYFCPYTLEGRKKFNYFSSF